MQILGSHSRPTASEMLGTQQPVFSKARLEILMHTKVAEPLPFPLVFYFSAMP